MSDRRLLEICCDSEESALAAAGAGADRIELCVDLHCDGLTPPPAMVRAVKSSVAIPVFVLVRCRAGGFVFSDEELRVMGGQIESVCGCGADGIYLFNYPCWTQITAARSESMAAGLENPDTAKAKPLLFSLPITHHIRKDVIDGPGTLPLALAPNAAVTLELDLPSGVDIEVKL